MYAKQVHNQKLLHVWQLCPALPGPTILSLPPDKKNSTLQLVYCNWLCLCPFNTEHFEFLQCYSFVVFLLGTSLCKSVSVNLEAFSYTVKLTLEEGWDLADAPDDGWSGNKSLMLIP